MSLPSCDWFLYIDLYVKICIFTLHLLLITSHYLDLKFADLVSTLWEFADLVSTPICRRRPHVRRPRVRRPSVRLPVPTCYAKFYLIRKGPEQSLGVTPILKGP